MLHSKIRPLNAQRRSSEAVSDDVIPALVIDGDSGTRAAFLSTSVRLRLQLKGINRSHMSLTSNTGTH